MTLTLDEYERAVRSVVDTVQDNMKEAGYEVNKSTMTPVLTSYGGDVGRYDINIHISWLQNE